MVCSCQRDPVFMNLLETQRPQRSTAESVTPYLEFTEEELAAVTLKPPKPRPQPEPEDEKSGKSDQRRDPKGRRKKKRPQQEQTSSEEE